MIIDNTPRVVLFGKDARKKIIDGANMVADAVKVTLGPRGRHVVIDKSPRRSISVTKDGVTVAKEINPVDIAENTGAQLLKRAAINTVDLAGDGTTTATVLAQALLNAGFNKSELGANPVELSRGMTKLTEHLVEYIGQIAVPIESLEDIRKVAFISCNNDAELGNLVADTLFKVSSTGAVVIEESHTNTTVVTTVQGMQLDSGIEQTSRYFVTDVERMEWVKEDCIVITSEETISSMAQLENILKGANAANKPVLIIARDFDEVVIHNVVTLYLRGEVNCCLVKAPGYGEYRRARLKDISMFTKSNVFAPNLPYSLVDKDAIKHGGVAKKVIVTENKLIILEGAAMWMEGDGPTEEFRDYVDRLMNELTAATDEFEIKVMRERIATLTGGTAVIRVGGMDEVEVGEKKDRIDDAVHAVRCAMTKGIVPGGGSVYLKCSKEAEKFIAKNKTSLPHDQVVGMELVRDALTEPTKIILNNAGADSSIVNEVLASLKTLPNAGYDAYSLLYVDNMIKAGIVDPALVSVSALKSAVNIAGVMLTTGCLINYHVQDNVPTHR